MLLVSYLLVGLVKHVFNRCYHRPILVMCAYFHISPAFLGDRLFYKATQGNPIHLLLTRPFLGMGPVGNGTHST